MHDFCLEVYRFAWHSIRRTDWETVRVLGKDRACRIGFRLLTGITTEFTSQDRLVSQRLDCDPCSKRRKVLM
jgi:hypothetical protein